MNVIPIIKSFFLKKVTCEDVNTFLADYLEGQLDTATHKAFENHLAMCPNCVPFLEQYQTTIQLVTEEREVPIPDMVVEHTLSFLKTHINGTDSPSTS